MAATTLTRWFYVFYGFVSFLRVTVYVSWYQVHHCDHCGAALTNRPQLTFNMAATDTYTVMQKKVYHPTFSDNFNSSCPIPVIFGTVIAE